MKHTHSLHAQLRANPALLRAATVFHAVQPIAADLVLEHRHCACRSTLCLNIAGTAELEALTPALPEGVTVEVGA